MLITLDGNIALNSAIVKLQQLKECRRNMSDVESYFSTLVRPLVYFCIHCAQAL